MIDTLKDLPGVQVIGGASSTDISIRCIPAKYTMILVDGKRVDTCNTRPNSDGSGIELSRITLILILNTMNSNVIRQLVKSALALNVPVKMIIPLIDVIIML